MRTKGLYGIGAVANMLGIAQQTLRTWEDRYGQVVPARTAGGQRLYSQDQVEQLRFVVHAVSRGLQPADAHRLLAEQGRATRGDRSESEASEILIADRDRFAADLCGHFLRADGHEVQIALDPGAARAALDEEPPALAVIDLLIAGTAGAELCRFARQERAIPVLALSSLESRDEALSAGADAFLRKPVDPLGLVSTVRELLASVYRPRPLGVT